MKVIGIITLLMISAVAVAKPMPSKVSSYEGNFKRNDIKTTIRIKGFPTIYLWEYELRSRSEGGTVIGFSTGDGEMIRAPKPTGKGVQPSFKWFREAQNLSRVDEQPYEGYTNDLTLLRNYSEIKSDGKPIQTSSIKATSAAYRLFSKVSFLFKTREEVIAILGNPATISDYGVKMEKGKDSAMFYRFDTGFGGLEYKLTLQQDQVVGVEFNSLD